MLVEELLLRILEDLLKDEFETFKWFLTLDILGTCEPIPKAHLQDASRIQTVDKLLRSYGEETAVKITAEVLKKMKMNKAKEELMRSYAAASTGRSTPSSSSSSPSALSPAVMTAQEGSVIIAPTIAVGGSTTCNITIST